MTGLLKKKASAVIRTPCQLQMDKHLICVPALQSSIAKGWRDEGGVGWKTEKGKCISEKVALNGLRIWMHPLLISKRKSCLMLGCLGMLAANATRRLHNEIRSLGTYQNP